MLHVVVVAILVVVTQAQTRDQCCTSMQWEGNEDKVAAYLYAGPRTDVFLVSGDRSKIVAFRYSFAWRLQ